MAKLFPKAKALLSIVLVLCMLAVMLPAGLGAIVARAEGEISVWGGENDVSETLTALKEGDEGYDAAYDVTYLIQSAADLKFLANSVNGGNNFSSRKFILTTDIDLNGLQWTPIGGHNDDKKTFNGFFDGAGHTIKGLNITDTASYGADYSKGTGFFGRTGEGAFITNLSIKDATIVTTRWVVGGLVGYAGASITLTNCSSSGTIKSGSHSWAANCGGLVGYTNGGTVTITDCHTSGEVLGSRLADLGVASPASGQNNPEHVGGIIGQVKNKTTLTMTKTYSTATVSGTDGLGGLIGTVYGSADGTTVMLDQCYYDGTIRPINVNTGAVSSGATAGGLVGQMRSTSTGNVYFSDVEAIGCTKDDEGKISNAAGTLTEYYTKEDGLVYYLKNGTTETKLTQVFVKSRADVVITNCFSLAKMASTSTAATHGGLFGDGYKQECIDYPHDNKQSGHFLTIKNSFYYGDTTKAMGRPISNYAKPTTGATLLRDTDYRLTGLELENVYYLEGSYKAASGFTEPATVGAKTADQFRNGDVLALLNNADVWMQGPEYPVFIQEIPALSTLKVGETTVALKNGVVQYDIGEVADTVDKVEVLATSDIKGATVTVTVNDIVTDGNVALGIAGTATEITVDVTYKFFTTTYTINVYRKPTPWDGTLEPFPELLESDYNYEDFLGSDRKSFTISNASQLAFLADIYNSTWPAFTLTKAKGGATNGYYEITYDFDPSKEGSETLRLPGSTYNYLFGPSLIEIVADIDLGGRPWTPIAKTNYFGSTLEGNNHTITRFYYQHTTGNNTYGGLFGSLTSNAYLRNLHIKGATFDLNPIASNFYVGGFVGRVSGGDTFTNCSFDGDVITHEASYNKCFGAIAGYVNGSNIVFTNCWSTGTVDVQKLTFGGIFGQLSASSTSSATLTNCYSTINATATTTSGWGSYGGLVGTGYNGSLTLNNCYFAGTVPAAFPYPIAKSPAAVATTYNNIYYAADCLPEGTEAAGAGIGDVNVNAKTASEFADGTVTALLNGAETPAWATSTAGYPVLSEVAAASADALKPGAVSIRTSGVQGIRFKFGIKHTAQVDELKEYGILLAKMSTAVENGNGQLTLGSTYNVQKATAYTKGGQKVTLAVDPETGSDLFAAVLYNFTTKAKYETGFYARAYALYEDSIGQEIVVYTEIFGDDDSEYNSVSEVADYFINGNDAPEISDDVKDYLQKVLDVCAEQ